MRFEADRCYEQVFAYKTDMPRGSKAVSQTKSYVQDKRNQCLQFRSFLFSVLFLKAEHRGYCQEV